MTKTRYIILCLALAAVGLTSCKVGKAYQRPQMALPDSLGVCTDTISIADYDWHEIYLDSILSDLIDSALVYNSDMKIAAARVVEMGYRHRVATGKMLPGFSGRVNDTYERENHGGNALDADNTFDIQLLLSWELDLWGNLRWGREQDKAKYLASVEGQRAVQLTIIAEVAAAYYRLVALDTELDIVRRTLEAREEGVHLAQVRFEGGLTSETSYRQALVEQARTATLIPELERKIAIQQNDIAYLTGHFPRYVRRSQMPESVNLPDELATGLPSDLLERRPDIRQAEQSLIAANARVGVAFTDMFPRITVRGGAGVETLDMRSIFRSPYEIITGTLLAPIFNWGKLRYTWKAEKAAYEAEVHRYAKVVLNAFREADNAMENYDKLRQVYQVRAAHEASARSYMELAQLQYINGVINYLDVLDAQRAYFDAQIALSNAMRDRMLAVVEIYKALGGGWQVKR